jgi:hypothetical protein
MGKTVACGYDRQTPYNRLRRLASRPLNAFVLFDNREINVERSPSWRLEPAGGAAESAEPHSAPNP